MSLLPKEIKDRWLEIGRNNLWIRQAYDPPFTEESFSGANCASPEDLVEKILHGNWCLGQVWYLTREQICCINQIDGGDEWLTIKGKTPFESITFHPYYKTKEQARENSLELINRIIRATEEECKRLEY